MTSAVFLGASELTVSFDADVLASKTFDASH
jgi:hypothetical protein